MLYKDVDNVVNCFLNGIKDWILIYLDNEGNVSMFLIYYFFIKVF